MQTSDTAADGQSEVLEGVVPELESLERLLAGERTRQVEALQDFADDPALLQLVELQRKNERELDLFHVLGVAHSELHHSRFLAWLLDPQQTHELGDYFLRSFLTQTCANAQKAGLPYITPSQIDTIDWSGTEVLLERDRIDIRVLNRDARFACAIENKIWAEEGIGENGKSQLTWYRKTLERRFPNFARHYVFLSPSGMCSKKPKERKYWTPENYTTILQLVEQTMDHKREAMGRDVASFLRQYAETLRRNKIVPESTEIAKRAREIYLKHREAIELIYQNKPNYHADIKQMLRRAISMRTEWKLYPDDTNFVYFQPMGFTGHQGMQPSESHDKYTLVGCEFVCRPEGSTWFRVEIAPETESNKFVRGKVIDAINQNPGVFNSAGQVSSGWVVVHEEDYILNEADLRKWDDPDTRGKIEAWVDKFATERFPAMNDVIVNCLREYEAEGAGNRD